MNTHNFMKSLARVGLTKKASLTIAALFGIFLVILIAVNLAPSVQASVTAGSPNFTGANNSMYNLFPLVFIVIAILGAFAYIHTGK